MKLSIICLGFRDSGLGARIEGFGYGRRGGGQHKDETAHGLRLAEKASLLFCAFFSSFSFSSLLGCIRIRRQRTPVKRMPRKPGFGVWGLGFGVLGFGVLGFRV